MAEHSETHFCGGKGRCLVSPFCHVHEGAFDNLGRCDYCDNIELGAVGVWS